MPDSRLEIVGDEFLTSIDYDEFHVNLLFDRYVYRPMCTHARTSYTSILSRGRGIRF